MTQAVVRGLDNAFPITTMVDDKKTQWTDDRFEEYKGIIDSEIENIKKYINKYSGIKFAAQMPFGKPISEPGEKTFSPLDERVLFFK